MEANIVPARAQLICLLKPIQILRQQKEKGGPTKEAKSLGVREMDQSDERCSNGLGRWKIFLLLYEMLQEYGTHLVEAAWTHQVGFLTFLLSKAVNIIWYVFKSEI